MMKWFHVVYSHHLFGAFQECIQFDFEQNCTTQVYSVDFDSRYKEEEYFLQVYDQNLGDNSWLVVWTMNFMTFHILGMSEWNNHPNLTNSIIFRRGRYTTN